MKAPTAASSFFTNSGSRWLLSLRRARKLGRWRRIYTAASRKNRPRGNLSRKRLRDGRSVRLQQDYPFKGFIDSL